MRSLRRLAELRGGKCRAEKTYKAIYNHHPFTILGTPNILGVLKSKGYKTFDSICDEIYDHCKNDRKRLDLVINATNELLHTEKLEEIDYITKQNFRQLERNCEGTINYLNKKFKSLFG